MGKRCSKVARGSIDLRISKAPQISSVSKELALEKQIRHLIEGVLQ
jgi:hypothetical protein